MHDLEKDDAYVITHKPGVSVGKSVSLVSFESDNRPKKPTLGQQNFLFREYYELGSDPQAKEELIHSKHKNSSLLQKEANDPKNELSKRIEQVKPFGSPNLKQSVQSLSEKSVEVKAVSYVKHVKVKPQYKNKE